MKKKKPDLKKIKSNQKQVKKWQTISWGELIVCQKILLFFVIVVILKQTIIENIGNLPLKAHRSEPDALHAII